MPLISSSMLDDAKLNRRTLSSGASLGLGVFIGAIVVALLGAAGIYLWRQRSRQQRSRGRRLAHIDPTFSMYVPNAAHEKDSHVPISPFIAHHEEMMVQNPILHITSRSPTASHSAPSTAAVDERGRWNGRLPRTPNSADPLLAATSPRTADSGPPSDSGFSHPSASQDRSSRGHRARTPPVALELERARTAGSGNARVRQTIGGTHELLLGGAANAPRPPPAAMVPETAVEQSPSEDLDHPFSGNTATTRSGTSRHPFSGQITPPPRAASATSSGGRNKRSSIEKRPEFIINNPTSEPATPAPRYSLWGRLSSIGGLLHAPPTALPAYRSPRPDQNVHPVPDDRGEGPSTGHLFVGQHMRTDSHGSAMTDREGRLLPPDMPPPRGPVPAPPPNGRRR